MHLQPANHPLTDDELRERFAGLVRDGVEAFRTDPEYLVTMVEVAAERRRFGDHQHLARNVRIVDLHRQRRTTVEIAEMLGMQSQQVKAVLKKRVSQPDAPEAPAALSRASDAAERLARREHFEQAVRDHYAAGIGPTESARRIGVSLPYVSQIRDRLDLKPRIRGSIEIARARRERILAVWPLLQRPSEIARELGVPAKDVSNDLSALRKQGKIAN